eukprot:3938626-Rhodomonas_salina.3
MDYNLGDTRTCLVGNWSEEKRLHEYAGHYRAAPTKDSTSAPNSFRGSFLSSCPRTRYLLDQIEPD